MYTTFFSSVFSSTIKWFFTLLWNCFASWRHWLWMYCTPYTHICYLWEKGISMWRTMDISFLNVFFFRFYIIMAYYLMLFSTITHGNYSSTRTCMTFLVIILINIMTCRDAWLFKKKKSHFDLNWKVTSWTDKGFWLQLYVGLDLFESSLGPWLERKFCLKSRGIPPRSGPYTHSLSLLLGR